MSTPSRHAGLTDDEAFLIAVKRLGSMDEISREYAAEHSGRLWKQLVLHDSADTGGADASSGTIPFARRANGLAVALVLGVGAGIAVKATELLDRRARTRLPEHRRPGAAVPGRVVRVAAAAACPSPSSASPRRSPPWRSP